MNPAQIKILEKTKLYIKWNDDSESKIDLKYLRYECPCANCKGETVLLKTYRPAQKVKNKPESFQIKNIEIVGGYAIQITWKDGHNTGIYSWEYLKKLDEDQDQNKNQNYDSIL